MTQLGDLWTPTQHEAWDSFLLAQALIMRKLDQDFSGEDMPLDWFDVLIQLKQGDGVLPLSDLAEAVILSRSGLTRLLDRIERAGFITRTISPGDRRRFDVWLTEAGDEAVARLWPAHQRSVSKHFMSHLTEAELRQMAKTLAKLIEANRD